MTIPKPELSIVLPVYNEESGLKNVLDRIYKLNFNNEKIQHNFEVIVIDNNSTDKSAEVASQYPTILLAEKKQGYGAAYQTGLSASKGPIIITMDADGTYPVESIPNFVRQLQHDNLDFITTNRFPQGYLRLNCMPFINKVGNIILSLLIRLIYSINLIDSQSGMWIFRKNLYDQMILKSSGMQFSQEIKIEAIYYLKSRWQEITINYEDRIGHKKLNIIKDGISNLKHLILKKLQR